MELSTHHRTSTALASALIAVAAVVAVPGAAHATRLPADPITFVGTPAPMARFVIEAQAANVWAALQDIQSR
jgi:hypothetical protein